MGRATQKCELGSNVIADTLEIVFIQCSGRLFQSQSVDDRVVAGLRQIATGHEYLLLCIQHIDIDTDTDFVSELVGLQ